jgi:hypothetical protein
MTYFFKINSLKDLCLAKYVYRKENGDYIKFTRKNTAYGKMYLPKYSRFHIIPIKRYNDRGRGFEVEFHIDKEQGGYHSTVLWPRANQILLSKEKSRILQVIKKSYGENV